MEKYIMTYEIKKENKFIRILGEEFVKNNKNKGRIFHKNKGYPLHGIFFLGEINNKSLKIIMLLSKNCLNKSYMFKDCSSLIQIKFDNNIYNRDDILFNENNNSYIRQNGNNKIKKFENINTNNIKDNLKWNTKISVLNEIFSNCSSLIYLPDISDWDTSNIIDMSKIFYNCRSLSSLPDISKWDTKNVIDMNKMLYNCFSLSLIPNISSWNINNVHNKFGIFYNCSSLVSLNNISKWNDNKKDLTKLINGSLNLMSFADITKEKSGNLNLNYIYEKTSLIIKLIYEIQNEKEINIFHPLFVENNRKKCKMVINNKIYFLNDIYHIYDEQMKFLKIKLLILKGQKINFRSLFCQCKFLKEFSVIPKKVTKLKNIFKYEKDFNQIGSIKAYNLIELNNEFSHLNNIYKTSIETINILNLQIIKTNLI